MYAVQVLKLMRSQDMIWAAEHWANETVGMIIKSAIVSAKSILDCIGRSPFEDRPNSQFVTLRARVRDHNGRQLPSSCHLKKTS
jgi:hypothetical protein